MSLRKKLSFRTKAHLECEESSSFAPPVACKQNGQLNNVSLSSEQGVSATTLENFETPSASEFTDNTMLQVVKNIEELGNSFTDNEIAITETRVKTQSGCDHPQTKDPQSLAIPDGLAMDPLAPTTLVVSTEFMDRIGSGLTLLKDHGKKIQKYVWKNKKFDVSKKSWKSIANVVLVEAKDLPDGPAGSSYLYCKFKLGNETHKSKLVPKSKPTWCERFNLYQYDDNNLEVTLWLKGKQKNFMGRCIIDLCHLEKEKTHELRQELECGYGTLHLLVTLSGIARSAPVDDVPTSNGVHPVVPEKDKYTWYRLDNDWSEVGQLSVSVHGARGLSAGLSGSADAYCVLELDNSRVQTYTIHGTSEPNWNKSYIFGINDITSTLDITVYEESLINSMKGEIIGKVSIPLLRISNGEKKWYALKDRSKKSSAKGNFPRILLEMSIVWNPIKASLRVLSPKEIKYVQNTPKFDIPLIYSNLKFIRDIFNSIYMSNEYVKQLFEWDNREKSVAALIAWLAFWYFFRLWMTPLLMLVPFIYHWIRHQNCKNTVISIHQSDDEASEDEVETKDNKPIKTRLYGLQDLTFTIKDSIDYIVSLIERIKNLSMFTVPYLSYLAMTVLVLTSVALYLIPVNYLFMALGIYKFMRKYLNPERTPNNDLLDFLSRVPDNKILKEWHELKVPEPNLYRLSSTKRR